MVFFIWVSLVLQVYLTLTNVVLIGLFFCILLALRNYFPVVSGFWNSNNCGSDVSMENAANPPSTYYDSSLQDLLPLWASSLPHHKHPEVQCYREIFSLLWICVPLCIYQIYVFVHSTPLQTIRRTDLERVHLPAVFSSALWNSRGSNVRDIQSSLCHQWNKVWVRTKVEFFLKLKLTRLPAYFNHATFLTIVAVQRMYVMLKIKQFFFFILMNNHWSH